MTPIQREALAEHLKAAIATVDQVQTSTSKPTAAESRRLDDLQDKLIAAREALLLFEVTEVRAWLLENQP